MAKNGQYYYCERYRAKSWELVEERLFAFFDQAKAHQAKWKAEYPKGRIATRSCWSLDKAMPARIYSVRRYQIAPGSAKS